MRSRWTFAVLGGAVVLAAGSVAFAQARTQETAPVTQGVSPPPVDPIAFPHNVHAGDNRIDCQYCHFSAERSKSAGLPPVATCMGCHSVVAGRNNPEEVQKLRDYWDRGESIPWGIIYKVSEHVQFPHMRHIAAGLDCSACHGQVQEIGVISTLAQPLSMGWCLDCHTSMGASRDCTVCHY